ncbi:flavodoxin : Flavodoxin OS=Melioribacter roseus (strain JCM 17771 / P3M-2) GN=MROS_0154 PE=4 SV=1: OmdA [Gemmata massiliana]|uniref:Uncharacterized protein n=1 Tax=Gemmata massiliana TaxID=1210884 RepID=A0A6P2D6T3_9BACT|nr:hypothetical protein [Gemmata massiliana]VTR95130.1 flavodoxin : Flavodoxin OS=Melioribacter roseus (strain JCM 17771 / P3M-2) GN=MROS_0154 PE=4 SV=1: OmdA [Gemmata massiliana]
MCPSFYPTRGRGRNGAPYLKLLKANKQAHAFFEKQAGSYRKVLVFGVTDYSGKMTTAHYGAVAAREPRDGEVQQGCKLLGRRLAEWVAVVADGRKNQHPLAKPESRALPG